MTGPVLVSPSPDCSEAGGNHSLSPKLKAVEKHMVLLLKHINKSDVHRGRRQVRVEGKDMYKKINEAKALENSEGENRGR